MLDDVERGDEEGTPFEPFEAAPDAEEVVGTEDDITPEVVEGEEAGVDPETKVPIEA